ncbi:MAG: 3'-5' exonuclease [Saprospiraceae bacterium]
MNYIIFDIEATCWQLKNPNLVQEIIEIGAVKLNSFGEIEESFNKFIKPIINPILSNYCVELTNIKQETVNVAKTFNFVIEDFQNWIDIDDDNYLLCSWGSLDQKLLQSDCLYHRIDSDWTKHFINLKYQFHQIKKIKHPIGLYSVLDREGIIWKGQQHRAIYDAQNLAKLFQKYLDSWDY